MQGFFYKYYVLESPSLLERESNRTVVTYQQVWYHVVGTNQSQDMCLLSFPGNPTWIATIDYTTDNKCVLHHPGTLRRKSLSQQQVARRCSITVELQASLSDP